MFTEHNSNVTYKRHVSNHTSNNFLLAIKVPPTACVELGIVGVIVVALGEEMERSFTISHLVGLL